MQHIKARLWLAPFDRSSPPVQIPNVEGGSPKFGPGGDIFFRHLEAMTTFVYRVHTDGTGLRKVLTEPILHLDAVSPDGHWVYAWAPLPGNGLPSEQAFPLEGGSPIPLGTFTDLRWSLDGRSVFITGSATYVVPL